MSRIDAADLAQRLGKQAEEVCRTYLSNGRRQGNYWQVGDVRNTAGRSMFVRLTGPASGKGAAGKWQDIGAGNGLGLHTTQVASGHGGLPCKYPFPQCKYPTARQHAGSL